MVARDQKSYSDADFSPRRVSLSGLFRFLSNPMSGNMKTTCVLIAALMFTPSRNEPVENQSLSSDITRAKDKSMQGPSRGVFDPEFDPRARRWGAVDLIYDGTASVASGRCQK